MQDHSIYLVQQEDAYTDNLDAALDLGIVMLHFSAVASQWAGRYAGNFHLLRPTACRKDFAPLRCTTCNDSGGSKATVKCATVDPRLSVCSVRKEEPISQSLSKENRRYFLYGYPNGNRCHPLRRVDDNTLALFENQYPVQPMGVSYNSYVILDEKIAVMDSVDARAAEEWLSNVAQVLEGRNPDYLVVTHMEPDHSGSLMRLAQKYPEMKIVGNAKTFTLIKQFFGTGALSEGRMLEVGEGNTLSLGAHRLRFLLAPMVHWPEVMAAYEEEEKILFSADPSAASAHWNGLPVPPGHRRPGGIITILSANTARRCRLC